VEIRVLGPLALRSDAGPVELAGDLQRRLVAVLPANAGAPVSTALLVDSLWGEALPANPPAALHSQIARLRRSLGDDAVATDGPGYRLTVPRSAVDAHRFEALLDDQPPDGDADVERLATAVGLWAGRAYEGFEDVTELRAEAARLDELRLVAIERLGDALVAAGRSDEAVAELQAVVARQPFREQSVARLMRALHAAGRQGDALRAYTEYRERLAEELGLEPSAALRRLDAEIARSAGDPDDTGSAAVVGAPTLEEMTISYVASGRRPEVRIAVGRVGEGPTVIAVPAWVTSLDVTMSSRDPRSALLERLAATCRVVTYDQPGTGLSRGPVSQFDVDAGVADLRAVVEHVGGGPVTLLAMSAAGPTAIAFAARYADVVDRLVLLGTFGDPEVAFPNREFSRALVDIVRARWGTGSGMLAQLYRPGSSDDAGRRLATILRDSASGEVGAAYLAACYDADVGHLLPAVRCPVLVLHYRGDKVIPFRGGEHLAQHLPDARFVPLDGRYHLPDLADVERLERTITRFLA
jgi:DNA-binding SARP family transcriptional activator/pimeloyl-ACP methyl ester carboxylesterase